MKNHFKLEAWVMVLLPVLIIAVAMAAALIVPHASGPITPPGQITLSYSGGSDSSYFFVLDNRSAQAIYLRGTRGFWIGVIPSDTVMSCTGGISAKTEADNSPYRDLGGIKVSPEERLRLTVAKNAVTARHKGGECYVQLLGKLCTGSCASGK
jgi:hypothetical protein